MKPCAINPKTGKPYSRHRYEQKNLRVQTYVRDYGGGFAPYSYAYELVCVRCGFHKGTQTY